jgi:uncharacterized repeat protein (TIGR03803 family)
MKRIVPTMDKLNWGNRAYAVFVLCAMTTISLSAQTFTTLFSFDGSHGKIPYAALNQGTDGNLYGTTASGGANNAGTVFKVSPSGAHITLYSFCAQSGCVDGKTPQAGVVQGTDGNFYGTTASGGAELNANAGTLFKITPSGTLTTLHNFCAQGYYPCADGDGPDAALVQAANGDFYGTAEWGGAVDTQVGTVFKITPSGTMTTLIAFDFTDGMLPSAGLVQDANQYLYGTTSGGEVGGTIIGGTVFQVAPSGAVTTVYSFCSQSGCPDGQTPYAGLVLGTDGTFYGTTYQGGANKSGTVFKMTPAGALTSLYSFCSQSGCTDGKFPYAGLVFATDGNLYGTTYQGGANNSGTVFKITPTGALTTLYSFCSQSGCTDGQLPYAGLVEGTDGKLYGTTKQGGTYCVPSGGCGTIFSLSVGLGPFVKTLPHSGQVGQVIEILGTDLTGATSVTFNGTPATFTVNARTEITATVPTGATTGRIQVTTPGGTLPSAGQFVVQP